MLQTPHRCDLTHRNISKLSNLPPRHSYHCLLTYPKQIEYYGLVAHFRSKTPCGTIVSGSFRVRSSSAAATTAKVHNVVVININIIRIMYLEVWPFWNRKICM